MTGHELLLNLKDISCGYQQQSVVRNISLHLNAGDIGCLLGPSGCGKTTTLRAIAGFEPLQAGQIELAGEVLSRPGFTLPPEKRRIGMVFQDYALFPHLTVAENIAFGIRDNPERSAITTEMLELVNMAQLAARYPHELSGGQQQRVALARALAPEPRLLLLDEPFSNLDVALRRRLSEEVREILKARGTSAILVTHDQEEAFAVCDQVGVFNAGQLDQWDTPFNLYHEPATPFVASFVGQGYFVRGRLLDHDSIETALGVLRGNRSWPWGAGTEVDILLRPDDIQPDPASPLRARIQSRTFLGATTRYQLTLDDATHIAMISQQHEAGKPGEQIGIRIDAEHLVAFLRH